MFEIFDNPDLSLSQFLTLDLKNDMSVQFNSRALTVVYDSMTSPSFFLNFVHCLIFNHAQHFARWLCFYLQAGKALDLVDPLDTDDFSH